MSVPGQTSVWDLWSEAAKNAETASDPVFQECLQVALEGKIFQGLADDKLKQTLSTINSLLNDPKTKSIGLTVFLNFVEQIQPSRLVSYQDAVISSLHLVVKGLESPAANIGLATFLPKCHELSEVNQVVTTSIVPKILGYLTDESRASASQRSHEELSLLKVCLLEYHGPCGNQREKLEKLFVPLLDSDNLDIVQMASEVLPLLSYAGGGGNGGERHIKDWNLMFTKCLKTAYSTLLQLYADNWPSVDQENPFEGEIFSGLRKITDPQVLQRLSLLKRRLQNLLTIISGYLRFPFPAPKHVPMKGTLKLISGLVSVVPLGKSQGFGEASRTKEAVYLSALAPSVHLMAFTLMKALFSCVGSNVFTETNTIERLISSEFKWLQESPRAFENLKCTLYETLITWLNLTGGSVTTSKTLELWVNSIGIDTRVEKDVVELKIWKKPKPGKSVKLSNHQLPTISDLTTQAFVKKSHAQCILAFKTLSKLISSLDRDNYKKVYEHLLKTASIINQFQEAPTPYDSPKCKQLLYDSLATMCFHPNVKSPISLALTINIIKKGMNDPTSLVNNHCAYLASHLERLIHPASSALMLASLPPQPIVLNATPADNSVPEDTEMEIEDDSSPHDEPEVDSNVVRETNSDGTSTVIDEKRLTAVIQKKIEDVLNDVFSKSSLSNLFSEPTSALPGTSQRKEASPHRSLVNQFTTTTESEMNQVYDVSDDCDDEADSPEIIPINGNGNGIHSADTNGLSDEDISLVDEISTVDGKWKSNTSEDNEESEVKKLKTSSPIKQCTTTSESVEGPSFEEMLSSFIDVDVSKMAENVPLF